MSCLVAIRADSRFSLYVNPKLTYHFCRLLKEVTRWSILTDEACDALTGRKGRLTKVSSLGKPTAGQHAALGHASSGGSSSSEGVAAAAAPSTKMRSAKGMLGRLSLGGSKKSLADVFAIDPSPRKDHLERRSSGGSGSVHSFSSAHDSSSRSMRGSRGGSGGYGDVDVPHHEKSQRQHLFGERRVDSGAGREGTAKGQAHGGVGQAHATVSEARDLAIERGEKLDSMVDKSRQLEDSAMAFGDMAKQLRRQQEDESCSLS